MRHLYILFGMLMVLFGQAQDEEYVERPFQELVTDTTEAVLEDIRISFKTTSEGLKIRWAPTSPGAWLQGNEYGYTLERMKMDSLNSEGFIKVGDVFKPWPLDRWELIVNDDTPYRAAAAMTIHGESKSESESIVEQARDLENRWGFGLLSADLDWTAAEASGLGYVERLLEDSTLYIYRVYVNGPAEVEFDTVYEVAMLSDLGPFMAPTLSKPEENENAITLKWSVSTQSPYTGYFIERSTDQASWTRVNETPFIPMTTNIVDDLRVVAYEDSVEVNYLQYYYRIVGLDAFGDESQPSEVISAMAKDRTLPSAPFRIAATELEPGAITVEWQWERMDFDNDFKGFDIYKSLDYEEGFEKMNQELLSADTRQFVDPDPDPRETNYYYVSAVDEEGNESRSVLAFGVTKDEIPPGPPTNLRTTVDTTGLLLLEWDAPADKDVRGYQVLYSNAGDAEFGARSGDYLPSNHFVDSISLATLTKNIFYYVIAIDYSYNQSIASEILEVERPDIIAPEASIFTDYRVSEEGIYFEWLISTSNDVSSVELQKKEADGPWRKVEDFDPSGSSYLDRNVKGGMLYSYELVTIDESGNETRPEKPLVLEGLNDFFISEVQNARRISNDSQTVLQWEYDEVDYVEFIIYRGTDESSLSTYRKVENAYSADVPSFDIKEGQGFWIKAKGRDGRESKLIKFTQ